MFGTVHNDINPNRSILNIGTIFTPRRILTHYGVVPIVVIMAGWMVLNISATVYGFYSKDYQFDRSHKRMVHQTMDLNNPWPMKLLTYNQVYRPMEDLARLLKEMDDEAKEDEEEGEEQNKKK